MPVPVFVSVHDVMPETLGAVQAVLDQLLSIPNNRVHLLVVPGCDWNDQHLAQLTLWQQRGFVFSGHGRVHRCQAISTIQHRIHSLLISRNVAEHLSLESEEIAELIRDCYHWFGQHGLNSPNWYVPPAWAMGKISLQQLAQLPFRYYEFQTGVLDSQNQKFYRMPLIGFEADSVFRAGFLTLFNLINRAAARVSGKPLRLSIHPYDFDHRLCRSLQSFVANCDPETAPTPYLAVMGSAWFGDDATD